MELAEIGRAVLGADLSENEHAALSGYLALLQRWNATYTLTAVRDPAQMLVQHLADCLAMLPPLRRRLAERPARGLLDVGSGAGLPGAVIAVLEPTLQVTCVDTVGKKVAFIRQVAGELKIANLHAEHARIEQWSSSRFDIVTSRAFASLTEFCASTRRHLASDGVWLAMKGKTPHDEIAALPPAVQVFHVEPLTVPGLAAERCLVWMRPASA